MELADDLASESYCYLTTTGRVTGRPHTIEIWFGARGRSIYLLSGGREKSDWVRNLKLQPDVDVRIAGQHFKGHARLVTDPSEYANARYLLVHKYQPERNDDLTSWGQSALPVAIDLELSALPGGLYS